MILRRTDDGDTPGSDGPTTTSSAPPKGSRTDKDAGVRTGSALSEMSSVDKNFA